MTGFTPLMKRAALAKSLGLLIGIVGFILVRASAPEAPAALAWGVLALYVTIGGVVGLIGIVDRVPIFDLPLWPTLRGFAMGAWFAILILLFAYDPIADMIRQLNYLPAAFKSPVWFIIEAGIIAALLDIIATRTFGQGERELLA